MAGWICSDIVREGRDRMMVGGRGRGRRDGEGDGRCTERERERERVYPGILMFVCGNVFNCP